jgi:leucyl/phenylalanyl-tRNA---protein transferase
MIPWLETDDPFPPLTQALREPNGLLAAGGALDADRLLSAYRSGIFPWYGEDQPVLWWSPDPRMVLFPAEFRLPRSLARRMRRGGHEIRIDTAFETVMRACAAPRRDSAGTWITGDMISAYCTLHRMGHAHSVETWIDGELAGGLYGIALGRMFYGESMFTRVADASKIALASLVRRLEQRQFGMIDCQMNTAHLARFGAREIPRDDFSRRLAELVNCPAPADVWHPEEVPTD